MLLKTKGCISGVEVGFSNTVWLPGLWIAITGFSVDKEMKHWIFEEFFAGFVLVLQNFTFRSDYT